MSVTSEADFGARIPWKPILQILNLGRGLGNGAMPPLCLSVEVYSKVGRFPSTFRSQTARMPQAERQSSTLYMSALWGDNCNVAMDDGIGWGDSVKTENLRGRGWGMLQQQQQLTLQASFKETVDWGCPNYMKHILQSQPWVATLEMVQCPLLSLV